MSCDELLSWLMKNKSEIKSYFEKELNYSSAKIENLEKDNTILKEEMSNLRQMHSKELEEISMYIQIGRAHV